MSGITASVQLYHISADDPTPLSCPLNCFPRLARHGVDMLQIRRRKLSARELLAVCRRLRTATAATGCRLLLNDRVDIALAAGLDGVHLRSAGLPVRRIRSLVPPDFIIGRSTHSLEEALRAEEEGADFITLSPIFDTPSKRGILAPLGLKSLQMAADRVKIPVFALGGIDIGNARHVLASGVAGLAGIRLFHNESDLDRLVAMKRPPGGPIPISNRGIIP